MTLEILQSEMISAMKAKDKLRKDTISSLVSAVKKAGIDNKCRDDISETLVDTTLIKEQKTMQEMIDTCPIERVETLAEYQKKMEIIKEFAPQLMTDPEEIKMKVITFLFDTLDTSTDFDKKNRGAIMKLIVPEFKGKADMSIVNKVINEILI